MIRIYGCRFTLVDKKEKRKAEHQAALTTLAKGLHEIYALEYSLSALQDEWQLREDGKPFLKGHPDICFNISHSGGIAVCAFAAGEVGADIERVVPVRAALIKRVLHEEEKRVLTECTADRVGNETGLSAGDLLFFRYWTLKESYLKMTGTGLRTEPRELLFHIDPASWNRPVCAQNRNLFCHQQMIGDSHVLSVCTEEGLASEKDGEPVQVVLFDADEFGTINA